jgi:coenzyme A diphosphatase NUDT7
MVDDNDKNIIETALREANEEIGIQKENIYLIAQTIPMTTTSRTLVYPVIVFFDDADYKPKVNKDEVDHVFKIPTIRFIQKENHEHKSIKLRNGDEYYVHYFKDTINGIEIQTWGLTALICIITSTILHSRAPEFTVDPKFDFNKLRFKKRINEYLKYILAKNVEIVNAYNKTKQSN